jgi:hypothetical protein
MSRSRSYLPRFRDGESGGGLADLAASAGRRSRTDTGPFLLRSTQVSPNLRGCGTPETILVSDLVRTHTSPGQETARKLSLRAVDLR